MNVLVHHNFVKEKLDEFGEPVYAADAHSCLWQHSIRGDGLRLELCRFAESSDPLRTSRLDLVAILKRQGFDGSSGADAPWTPDGKDIYMRSALLNGPTSYFAALVMRHAIISKGAVEIRHHMCSAYYKCLVTLDDMRAVQALVDRRAAAADFANLLGGGQAAEDAPLPMLEDAVDGGGVLDDVADAGDEVAAPPVPLEDRFGGAVAMTSSVPLPRVGGHANLYVHFDNFTHRSGILRGYVKCCWGHEKCHKYMQLNVAGTKRRLVAFLLAWQQMGSGVGRDDHSGHDPSDAAVAAALDAVPEDV